MGGIHMAVCPIHFSTRIENVVNNISTISDSDIINMKQKDMILGATCECLGKDQDYNNLSEPLPYCTYCSGTGFILTKTGKHFLKFIEFMIEIKVEDMITKIPSPGIGEIDVNGKPY